MLAAIIKPDTEQVAVILEDDHIALATVNKHGCIEQIVLQIEPVESVLTVVQDCSIEVQVVTYIS